MRISLRKVIIHLFSCISIFIVLVSSILQSGYDVELENDLVNSTSNNAQSSVHSRQDFYADSNVHSAHTLSDGLVEADDNLEFSDRTFIPMVLSGKLDYIEEMFFHQSVTANLDFSTNHSIHMRIGDRIAAIHSSLSPPTL